MCLPYKLKFTLAKIRLCKLYTKSGKLNTINTKNIQCTMLLYTCSVYITIFLQYTKLDSLQSRRLHDLYSEGKSRCACLQSYHTALGHSLFLCASHPHSSAEHSNSWLVCLLCREKLLLPHGRVGLRLACQGLPSAHTVKLA